MFAPPAPQCRVSESLSLRVERRDPRAITRHAMVLAHIPPIDWINAVIIPAIMTIFLGGWVGLVCTRVVLFYQARYKASSDIYMALPALKQATTPNGLVFALGNSFTPAMLELAALGHSDAAMQLNVRIGRRAHEKAAEILGLPVPESGPPHLPDLDERRFLAFREEFVSGFYLRNLNDTSKWIARELKPNVWALINPWPLPRYKHAVDLALEIRK